MANPAKVKIQIVLDEEEAARVIAGFNKVAISADKITTTAKATRLGDQFGKDVDKAADSVKNKLNPALKETKDAIKIARAESAALRKQVSADIDDLVIKQIGLLRSVSGNIAGVGQSALLVGGGIAGGIFLAAKNYIKDAKQADDLTRKWARSTAEIEESQKRIGRVAAQAVLPLLEQAASVSSKVANFVEDHPELIKIALNTGILIAGFGTLALAVSKGIKLVADVKFLATIPIQLTAAKMQDLAADKQLLAAQLRLKELGVDAGDLASESPAGRGGLGASLLSGIKSPLGSVGLILATAAASNAAAGSLKKLEERLAQIGGSKTAPFIAFLDTTLQTVNPLIPAIKNLRVVFERDLPAIKKLIEKYTGLNLGGQIDAGGGTLGVASVADGRALRFAANMEELVGAWEDFRQDEVDATREHASTLLEINQDRFKAELAENKQYADSIRKITEGLSKTIADIQRSLSRADTQAYAQLIEAERKAEENYQRSRQEAVEATNENILRIQADLNENLIKLEKEHAERKSELLASRDAAGLLKEKRRHDNEVAEAHQEASAAIREQRLELQQRLADMRENFVRESAERRAEYERARTERHEDAALRIEEARQQAAEQLAEAAANHAEELKQIREQAQEKLAEENRQYAEERRRRYNDFIQRIRDIDAAQLGETNARRQHYRLMITELEQFLLDYRNKHAAGLAAVTTAATSLGTITGSVGTRASGGYAPYGMYILGDKSAGKGPDEFVMNGETTRAAESIIRGRLTQQGILRAMIQRASVTWNDHRKFDSRLSAQDRRMVNEDTLSMLSQLVQQ